MTPCPPSILITGASGFVGSYLVETAIAQGFETWAAVRKNSSTRYLGDKRTKIISLELNDSKTLSQQILKNKPQGWNYIIHAAGATKALKQEDFDKANYITTRNLVETLQQLNLSPKRFVLISSLATQMPRHSKTLYSISKTKAEHFLKNTSTDYIILQPTGVYGPRDKDYLLAIKSIQRHLEVSIGFKPQQLTFIYVKDLCDAALSALINGPSRQTYQLSDGKTYSNRDFNTIVKSTLNIKHTLHVTIPLTLLKLVCLANTLLSQVTKTVSPINKDKYLMLKQRDWTCVIDKARQDLSFHPRYDLKKGMAETISWYKKKQWI
ncbi:MAG: NAD-dependent epimerase/dehydratase family protein [Bacteroidaceae bacterium]